MIVNTGPRKRGRPRLLLEKHQDINRLHLKAFETFQKWAAENLHSTRGEDVIAFLQYCLKHYESPQNTGFIEKMSRYSEFQIIGENIGKLYNILHHTSPMTYPIMNILSRNMTRVSFSEI